MKRSMLNRSVYDAFRCLNLLVTVNRPMGIREIGRELALDSAKVTRLMQTLLALEMVFRNEKRKYTLGLGVHRFSASAIHHSAFYTAAIDLLEEIGNHSVSIVIGVLSGKNVVYLIHTRKGKSAARAIGNYDSVPIRDSIIGIKLLAAKSDEEIVELIGVHDFHLLKGDIDAARRHQVLVKTYADGESRMACLLPGMQAAIALSNLSGDTLALETLQKFLVAAAKKLGGG
ncbi:Regulatory protein, IclR-family [Sodalis praecaptivus]|uniref:Regulatory protein, IclR-family n=2 Tax=Bruguierivoracaceae TaxID=2812006 RepID=W0HTA9_9GAMM|nr:Regulatory protein, IclR-family [Sodalis praecaptivus]